MVCSSHRNTDRISQKVTEFIVCSVPSSMVSHGRGAGLSQVVRSPARKNKTDGACVMSLFTSSPPFVTPPVADLGVNASPKGPITYWMTSRQQTWKIVLFRGGSTISS